MILRVVAAVLVVAVFVAGLALGYFNSAPVRFHYLFGAVEVRLAVLLAASFIAAALLTLLLCGVRMLTLSGEARRLRRRLRDAETELKNLRNLQLPPEH